MIRLLRAFLLLQLASGFLVLFFEIVWPGDQTLWRKAAVAFHLALPRPVHRRSRGGGGRRVPGLATPPRGRIPERPPTLDPVELGEARVEVDPHHRLLQLRVTVEQRLVAMNKRLQYLHRIIQRTVSITRCAKGLIMMKS